MTNWGPRYVIDVARKAGWSGDDLASAVAMALASSAGADHYVGNVIGGDENERRGLWALTPSDAAPTPPHRLWHPQDNASAAYGRWAAEGGTWGWHPAWWGQLYAPALDFATALIAKGTRDDPNPPPLWHDRLQSVRALGDALHGKLASGG